MDSLRWDRMQSLFHAALDRPIAERDAFLRGECEGDDELRVAVAAMLEEDARSQSPLEDGIAGFADRLLGTSAHGMSDAQTFGPYRIVRTIGEGGMGVVYLAEREDLGSVAAIKILRDAWLSPARRERFASEQRTLARLDHPGIARLFDAGTLPDGTPWIVMEYVDGVSLVDYCRTHRSSLAERLRLLRAVCDAVQYAHRNLIVHRDLKPSNILVRGDGSVKLLDFGIAKHLTPDTEMNQTVTGFRLMTPAYAAPEQVRGRPVGIHTDVYCLGVVLYELLTDRLPFDITDRTSAEIEMMIVETDPERPSVVARRERTAGAASLPAVGKAAWSDLDVLCATAMHKDPSRRYPTADALIRDIDHFLRDEPLDARPDSLRYRAGKFGRRHWRPLAAVAATLLVVIGVVTFYTVRLAVARNAAVTQAVRAERIQQFMLTLFNGGDTAAGPPDQLRVVTLLDRGVQEARSLDSEPAVQAALYETLGSIYRKLGQFDRADGLLRSALDRRRALFGADDPEVAQSLVALGQLRDAQAAYDEAERLIRDALAKARSSVGPADVTVARATVALGQVLEDRGSYDKAIPILEEAVRLNSLPGREPLDLGGSLTELANTHFYLGHYDASTALNTRAIDIYRRVYGNSHPLIADALINLGAIEQEQGRFAQAERFHRQALEIYRAWYGPDHPETASALTMVGRALIQQNRLEEGGEVMREALAVQEHVYGPVHPRVASALNEIGNLALRQGRLDEAEASFRRMVDVYKQVYHDKHYYIGIALSNLAAVYQERHDYVTSERLFREVLQRYADTLPPEHQLVGIAHVRLGHQIALQKRYADASRESQTGYDILMKQVGPPPAKWVDMAREDLATAYDAQDRHADAERFRQAAAQTKSRP